MSVALQGSLLDTVDEVGLRPLDPAIRRTALTAGAWIDVRPGWLTGADQLFSRLARDVAWQAERRQMYDREVEVPRLLNFYEENERLPDAVLTQARSALSGHYAGELGEPFRTAGLCLYRDGRDSVAWHGDTIGRGSTEDTMVAIISVGAVRTLALRPARRRPDDPLRSGSRRPARHGRQLPAHVGARGAENAPAGRAPDQHPVPTGRCALIRPRGRRASSATPRSRSTGRGRRSSARSRRPCRCSRGSACTSRRRYACPRSSASPRTPRCRRPARSRAR